MKQKQILGSELKPWSEGMQLLSVTFASNEPPLYQVLSEVAKIRNQELWKYVEEAVREQVEGDLDNPQDIGLDVCRNLKAVIFPNGEPEK